MPSWCALCFGEFVVNLHVEGGRRAWLAGREGMVWQHYSQGQVPRATDQQPANPYGHCNAYSEDWYHCWESWCRSGTTTYPSHACCSAVPPFTGRRYGQSRQALPVWKVGQRTQQQMAVRCCQEWDTAAFSKALTGLKRSGDPCCKIEWKLCICVVQQKLGTEFVCKLLCLDFFSLSFQLWKCKILHLHLHLELVHILKNCPISVVDHYRPDQWLQDYICACMYSDEQIHLPLWYCKFIWTLQSLNTVQCCSVLKA